MRKYLKIHRFYLITIITISFLPLLSIILPKELIHTHDGLVHLARIGAYYKALSEGHIPPRFAGNLNYGYGVPLFIFIYHIPYLVASFFIFLHFDLADAFRFTLSLSYIFSGVFCYGFLYAFYKNRKKAFLGAIFYQFFPFRLIEILYRGSFGEVYTYTFLPLALLFILYYIKQGSYKNFVGGAIAVSLLITTHNSVSLIFFGLILLFIIIFSESKRKIYRGLLVCLGGLLLSAWYFIPAILEHKYTYGDLYMRSVYKTRFVPLIKLFFPNIFNNKDFRVESIPTQIGLFHIIAYLYALYVFMKSKKKNIFFRKIFLFATISFLVSLFFMNKISIVIWESFALLRQFQFPWRFLALLSLPLSMIGVYLGDNTFFKKKSISIVVLILLVVISTYAYWFPDEGYDNINESYYWNYPLNTTYYGETDTIWTTGPFNKYPVSPVEIIAGEGKVENIKKYGHFHTYRIYAKTKIQVVDHTVYFPGWRVYVDQKKIPIEFQDNNWRGEITYYVEKGNHDVRVFFGRSRVRFIGEIISMVTLIIFVLWGLFIQHAESKKE